MKIRDMSGEQIHAMLTKALKMPADSSNEVVLAELDRRINDNSQRAVDNAIRSGKIMAAQRDFWMKALTTNHLPAMDALNALPGPLGSTLAPAAVPLAPTAHASATSKGVSRKPVIGMTPQQVLDAITKGEPVTPPPGVSAETLHDAAVDAELWELGFRDGVEPPPGPKWHELFPPEQV
ncbi:hypothetical protein BOH72_23375 [Mycobacterium sp. WY10]|nr:hypothetical protein BOH72_23375 [Mycobacterium sp. WY10]